jgi:DNA ligase 4
VFFDILALDEFPVLCFKQCERRKLLEDLIHCNPGHVELSEYQLIHFSAPHAAAELRQMFAKTIYGRDEGLVLKPADEPYFNLDSSREFRSCCIKLKKLYIGNLGTLAISRSLALHMML